MKSLSPKKGSNFKKISNETLRQLFSNFLKPIPSIEPLCREYLTDLLVRFNRPEQEIQKKIQKKHKTLAERFLLACQGKGGQGTRVAAFQGVGDTALFESGFFSNRFKRQLVGLPYYIKMGRTSYAYTSELFLKKRKKGPASIFKMLSYNFPKLVSALHQVRDQCEFHDKPTPLDLFERWSATGTRKGFHNFLGKGLFPLRFQGSGIAEQIH